MTQRGAEQTLRQVLASLEERIREHQEKIAQELQKPYPRWVDIEHWRKEIDTWQARRDRLLYRISRRRRRR
jgi:pyridoxine/pyridoxamine 5'-phosphate oxidase